MDIRTDSRPASRLPTEYDFYRHQPLIHCLHDIDLASLPICQPRCLPGHLDRFWLLIVSTGSTNKSVPPYLPVYTCQPALISLVPIYSLVA